jgi:3-phosphoshikimate 1-carboxyvinyltransferase
LQYVRIKKNPRPAIVSLELPASKSESNRALILEALAGQNDTIRNLSTARDTQTLSRLLKSKDEILDVLDAGTTMRFLTAYLSVTGDNRILTGTPRMCERPIDILVDALREVGGNISYVQKEGYPPLRILGFLSKGVREITMPGNVSSQFISAMLMVAARLDHGLTLNLTGKIGSRPYIEMTLGLMEHYGIKANLRGNIIEIPHQEYKPIVYRVDPDWSGASYWYGVVALAEESGIELKGYRRETLQGDRVIARIMDDLGVNTEFTETGIMLSKKSHSPEFRFDFSDCPDLAQTVIVLCAAKGIPGRFSGLESLRIKETDRITALQQELKKIGAVLSGTWEGEWILQPAGPENHPSHVEIDTYGDHRMAMAFAPLSTSMDLTIKDPEVVNKSYPGFWNDMGRMFDCLFV